MGCPGLAAEAQDQDDPACCFQSSLIVAGASPSLPESPPLKRGPVGSPSLGGPSIPTLGGVPTPSRDASLHQRPVASCGPLFLLVRIEASEKVRAGMPQHPFPGAETIQQTPKAIHDGADGHSEQIGRRPPCHTPLPHAITPHYPVSMNLTRKLPPVHLLTLDSRPDRESRGWDKGRASSRRKPSHPYGFWICFSYLQKGGSRLALQLDITSETIRRKTVPTGTTHMALAASSTPPMSRFSRLLLIPSDRSSAQPPLRFVHHLPPTMVIFRQLRFQTAGRHPPPGFLPAQERRYGELEKTVGEQGGLAIGHHCQYNPLSKSME